MAQQEVRDVAPPQVTESAPARNLLSGAGALMLANFLRLMLQLVSVPLLARLLGPYSVGLMAMAMPIILVCSLLCDLGFSGILIRESDRLTESTAFWIATTSSLTVAMILIGSASFVADLLHPDVRPLLVALSLFLPLTAFMAVPAARLNRSGRLGTFAVADLLGVILGLVVAIYGALLGWGVWALVAQTLVVALLRVIVLGIGSGFVPQARFHAETGRRLLGLSKDFTTYNLLANLSSMGDNLLVGAVLCARPAGSYSMSYQLARMPATLFSGPLYMAITAALSTREVGDEFSRRLYPTCTSVIASFVVPAMVGLMLLAQPIVDTLLGPQWTSAGPVFAALALAGLAQALKVVNIAFLTGLGDYRTQRIVGAMMAIGVVAGALIGSRWAVVGAAWGVSLASAATLALASKLVARRIGLTNWQAFGGAARVLVPSMAMAVAVVQTLGYVAPVDEPLVMMLFPIAVGGLIYMAIYWVIGGRRLLREGVELSALLRGK